LISAAAGLWPREGRLYPHVESTGRGVQTQLVGTPRCGVREWRMTIKLEFTADGAARRPYQSAAERDSLRLAS